MTNLPLSNFPITHGGDAASLRDAVDGVTQYEHAVLRSSRQRTGPGGIVNGVRSGEFSLVYVAYATIVNVFAPPTHDQVIVVLPLGPMQVQIEAKRWTMTEAFALSSASSTIMIPDPTAGALVGAIKTDVVTDLFSTAFGPEHHFLLDLSQPRPISLHAELAIRRSWLSHTTGDVAPDPAELLDVLTVGLAHSITYSSGDKLEPQQPPPYLLAALQHLRRHYSEQISLTSLSQSIGISPRQLQLAFRAHVSMTAQEYLQQLRLVRAHQLLCADQQRTVASVAAEVGIPHLGRFAQYFTQKYGMNPSQLRR